MRIILALVLESRTRNAARAGSDQQERLRLELSPSKIVSDNLRRSVVRIIITAPTFRELSIPFEN